MDFYASRTGLVFHKDFKGGNKAPRSLHNTLLNSVVDKLHLEASGEGIEHTRNVSDKFYARHQELFARVTVNAREYYKQLESMYEKNKVPKYIQIWTKMPQEYSEVSNLARSAYSNVFGNKLPPVVQKEPPTW
jgi:hypothetical protein